MGRFARSSERGRASDNQVKVRPRPSVATPSQVTTRQRPASADRDRANPHGPSEMKYFVLALAALIGLGIGWLSGKAITQSWDSTSATPASAEKAAPATFDGTAARAFATSADDSDEPIDAQADPPEAGAADDPNAPMAVVTEASSDDAAARATRRVSRRAVRRHQRGNIFFRPFKALRRLRVW